MTPEQKRDVRIAVLKALLHPASSLADLLEGAPAHEIRECLDAVTGTLNARLELLERAKKRTIAL
jgi:hypothetical protein